MGFTRQDLEDLIEWIKVRQYEAADMGNKTNDVELACICSVKFNAYGSILIQLQRLESKR